MNHGLYEPRKTAIHECGHAGAAVHLGVKFQDVSIGQEEHGDGTTAGRLRYDPAHPIGVGARMKILAAGSQAMQQLLGYGDDIGCKSDFAKIDARIRKWVHRADVDEQAFKAARDEIFLWAKVIVLANRGGIERCAEKLLETGRLNYEEFVWHFHH